MEGLGYYSRKIVEKWENTSLQNLNTLHKNQSSRYFHFPLSENPKITQDAFRLLTGFKLDTVKRKEKGAFIPISWRIYTLDKLLIQVKHEFNASNKDLYKEESLLAQGKIE